MSKFDRSLRGIVLLCKVLVEAGLALALQFGSTMLNAILKPLKVLCWGVWQSWSVPYRAHEDDESVLL
jgi:hypothetical protein